MRKKTRECNAQRAKVGELQKRLATFREAPKASPEKIEELESCVVLNVRAITQLATLVMDHLSRSFRVYAEKGELRRKLNGMKGKTSEAVLSAEQFHAKVSAVDEERDSFEGQGEELGLEVLCVAGLLTWPEMQSVCSHVRRRLRKCPR